MPTLIDKIEDIFEDDLRETVEVTTKGKEYIVVLREPMEDEDPREDEDLCEDDDMIDMYLNNEVYDVTVYSVETEEAIGTGGPTSLLANTILRTFGERRTFCGTGVWPFTRSGRMPRISTARLWSELPSLVGF